MNHIRNLAAITIISFFCSFAIFANAVDRQSVGWAQKTFDEYNKVFQSQQSISTFDDKDKYKFLLQLQKTEFQKGESIVVKITLKNIGSESIRIVYQLDGEEYSANNVKVKKNG